jgi:hypothetical protein
MQKITTSKILLTLKQLFKMKKLNFEKMGGGKILIAILFFFTFLSTTAVFGQSNNAVSCGTPDFPEVFRALKNKYMPAGISSTPENLVTAQIPVWLYFIEPTTGNNLNVSESEAIGTIQGVNTYFNGLFSFSVCGMTTLQNDDFNDLQTGEFNSLCDLVNTQNEPSDDKCLKVFFVKYIGNGAPPGYSWSPTNPMQDFDHSGIALVVKDKINAAHEFGHYFGLPHTFLGTQYVITSTTPQSYCYDYGDGFCDTKADLQNISFNSDCINFSCNPLLGPCVDPFGLAYDPDPTLLMSYHGDCRNRFSGEQKFFMRILFNNDAAFENLKNPAAVCIAPKWGTVIAHCARDNVFNIPLVNLDIEIKEGSNVCNRLTDINGLYSLTNLAACQINAPGQRLLTPQKNLATGQTVPKYLEPLNGVTVRDLSQISRHILNLEPFDNPYEFISADANNSGTITTFDIVTIRQVILGVASNFPIGSWRYVPNLWFNVPEFISGFESNNPFATTFLDPITNFTKTYNGNTNSWMDKVALNTQPNHPLSNFESSWSFTGTKVGDVDCSLDKDALIGETPINAFLPPTGGISIATTANTTKTIKVVLNTPKAVSAWQMGINYNLGDLTIGQVTDGNEGLFLNADNFYKSEDATAQKGQLNALWFSEDGTALNLNNKVLFTFVVNAKSNISKLENKLDLNQFAAGLKFYDNKGNLIQNIGLRLEEFNGFGLGNNNIAERGFNLEPSTEMEVQVSPVPFSNSLWFAINMPSDESATLSIFDMTGRLMLQNKQLLQKGRNDFEMDNLSDFPAGVYTYILKAGTLSKVGKLIK